MKARSIKAVLLAASLIFPTWSFAQTKSKDAAAYTNRGIAKLQKSDWDGAIADFDRALQFDPKLAQAYANRGDAKTEKGDFDGAIADFNRALQLNPKLAPAYAGHGSANFLAHNWTAALQGYRRFCELSQRNQAYPRLFIWIIRSRLGEREAADKELATHFNAEPGTWVSKVATYLLGNLSEVELFTAAASPDANTDRGQHCEAWFYAGMKNVLGDDKWAAAQFFKKCLATGHKNAVEYHFAKEELNALGQ